MPNYQIRLPSDLGIRKPNVKRDAALNYAVDKRFLDIFTCYPVIPVHCHIKVLRKRGPRGAGNKNVRETPCSCIWGTTAAMVKEVTYWLTGDWAGKRFLAR